MSTSDDETPPESDDVIGDLDEDDFDYDFDEDFEEENQGSSVPHDGDLTHPPEAPSDDTEE